MFTKNVKIDTLINISIGTECESVYAYIMKTHKLALQTTHHFVALVAHC